MVLTVTTAMAQTDAHCSYAAMRELVPTLADRVPAFDVGKLSYERGASCKGEIVAMLRHLDGHRDDGPRYAAQHYNRYTSQSCDDLDNSQTQRTGAPSTPAQTGLRRRPKTGI